MGPTGKTDKDYLSTEYGTHRQNGRVIVLHPIMGPTVKTGMLFSLIV